MSFILWVYSIVNEALRAALTARNIFFYLVDVVGLT